MKLATKFRAGLALAFLSTLTGARAQTYTIFDLSPNTTFDSTLAYGINQLGQATGMGYIASSGLYHALIYSNAGTQDLGTLGYPYGADGDRINNNGQVAATGYGPGYHALIYSNGQAHPLGSLDGGYNVGLAINNSGNIVGRALNGDGGGQAFMYVGGQFSAMGGTSLIAYGINDSNQIVGSMGYYWSYGGYVHSVDHGFVYANGSFTDVGSVGGGARTNTDAYAINNAGQVAGSSTAGDGTVHAFLYSGGVMQDLGTIAPYYAYPCAINNNGLIVGNLQTYVGGPVGGFLYVNGVMSNLSDLFDASGAAWSGLTVMGVNDSGWIVGYGTINGLQHGFIAAPTRPLPVSGTVTLQDFAAGAVAGTQVTIELRSPGSTQALDSHTVSLDSSGHFSFTTTLLPGSYDITTKAPHWLRKNLANQTLGLFGATGLSYSLVNGDIDGNNAVGLSDFARLKAAFGSLSGDANWNPNADLDGNGAVGLSDFAILKRNFGLIGDP